MFADSPMEIQANDKSNPGTPIPQSNTMFNTDQSCNTPKNSNARIHMVKEEMSPNLPLQTTSVLNVMGPDKMERNDIPVSYTHLTLPTNREV